MKNAIDHYCQWNHLEQPITNDEYIRRAERLKNVGMLTQQELDAFKRNIDKI